VPYWQLREVGKAPARLRAVTGKIEIRSDRAQQLKAWTLNVVGKRIANVPLAVQSGVATLDLRLTYETVYYELSAE
jgi:hypothetical protein